MLIQKKIQIGFGFALLFLLITGAATWWTAAKNRESFRAVNHTYEVINRLDGTLTDMLNVQTGERGFAITGDKVFLGPYEKGLGSVRKSLEELKKLVQDNPAQKARLEKLEELVSQKIEIISRVVDLRRREETSSAMELIATKAGKAIMDRIRALVDEMRSEEERLLLERSANAQTSSDWTIATVVFASLAALLLVGASGVSVRRDFEKRRVAEEERDRFFSLALDMLCIASSDGYFKRLNPAFTRVLGWSIEEMLARPFLDFVHPEDHAITLAEVEKQMARNEKVLRFVNRYQHKDGSWRWISWKSVPQPGGLMYATARDVTKLREAEEALRRSEESLAVTLNSIGDAVLATDTEGRVTMVNPVAEKLMGWTQAEALGHPISEVFKIINEDTREPTEIPVDKVLATGKIQGLANHTVIISRAGTECPIADSAAPIRDEKGQVLGVVLVFRDVSEEKKAEEALEYERYLLHTLMDNVPARIYFKDRESRFMRVNHLPLKLFGLDSPGPLMGRTDFDFFTDEHARQAFDDEQEVIRSGQPISKEEKETWPDGHVTWVLTSKLPFRDKNQRIVGTFGISLDITERKKAEEALRRSEESLAVTLDSIGDAVLATDTDGRVTRLNPVAEKLTGWTEAAAVGRPVAEVFHIINEGTREPTEIPVESVLATGKTQGLANHTIIISRDGTECPIADSAAPIRGEDGRTLGVVLVFRDVSAEKKAQQELEYGHYLLNTLMDNVDAYIYFKDQESRFLRVNRIHAQNLGVSDPQLVAGRTDFDFFPKEQARLDFADEREIIRTGQPLSREENLTWPDGRDACVLTSKFPLFDKARRIVGTFGISLDITERKKAEEALRRSEESLAVTLDSIGDAVLATDTGGRVTRLNPVAEKLTGWTEADALGRPVGEVFHILNEETRQPAEIPVQSVLATGKTQGLANHTVIIGRDGRETPIADSAAPIRGEGGLILGVVLVFRDVSAEKKAAAALEYERHLLGTLMDHVDAYVYFKDRESRFLRVNRTHARELGCAEHAAVVGKTDFDFFSEEHARQAFEDEQEIVRTGQPISKEEKETWPDGRISWVMTSKHPLLDKSGGIVGTFGISLDITRRKRTEEALRRSEESLAVTLNSIGDAVMATDVAGRITRLNPVAETLTGWKQAEAAGRPVAEVFHIINEETRQPAEIPVDKVLATGTIQGLANHTVIIARDGRETPIADSAAPIRGEDGRILGVVLVFRDVSEEKLAEQAVRDSERRLRQLNEELESRVEARTIEIRQALATLDAMEEAAFIFAPGSLRHSYVNEGAVRLLGYSREELLGMTPVELSPEFIEESYRNLLEPMVRGGARTHRFVTLHRHKKGRDIPVEINLQYITPADETPRFVTIVRDITERQKNERMAQRSQRLEAIGTLAGGVAHDLNNALAPIVMGVELIRMQYPRESQIIDLFQTSAKRGSDMVRQLLSFAKGAEGERITLQPGSLAREMENMMRASFPKNIRLLVKCATPSPTVLGDATQLHQVLLNLCVNARDAMPNGGLLTLEVLPMEMDATYASSITDAVPGSYVILRVRDTGAGIPPEILDRIFDPFFTTKDQDKGTGLGLSTVMGIVKGHGGFLQVYSILGQGSTFTIYLPADQSGGVTEAVSSVKVERLGQGETILLVDDEAGVREVARAVLRKLNFKPVTATDGADGLMKVAENRAELKAIVTDLHMPHMDGLAFVRTLRRILPNVPVVLTSGRMDETLLEEFKTLGVTIRLNKPFTEAELSEALFRALQT